MKTALYLDDLRSPEKQTHINLSSFDKVVHVKTYGTFCQWIIDNGLPDFISFDHDLHESHYAPIEHWVGTYRIWRKENKTIFPNGKDCAIFLVNYCLKNNIQLPTWCIHSNNPIGSYEITEVLMNYAESYYFKEQSLTKV